MTRPLPFLLLPLLLTGCLTGKVIDSAQTPSVRIKRDTLDAVHAAYVTDDHRLLVQISGSLGDSKQAGQFTINIPLTSHLDEQRDPKVRIKIPRSAVTGGWELTPWSSVNPKPIAVAPILVLRAGTSYDPKAMAREAVALGALHPVQKAQDYLSWELVFVSRPPEFKDFKYSVFELKEETVSKSNGLYYLALPLSVPVDIATFPFQLIFYIATGGSDNAAPAKH